MVDRLSTFSRSVMGASHIKAGTVCQDSSLNIQNDRYALVVVCDGHGGNDYVRSDRGSRFAADAVRRCVDNQPLLDALLLAKDEKAVEALLSQLKKSIIVCWNGLVLADVEKDPFSEQELEGISQKAKNRYTTGERIESAYGTTLVAAVVTDEFWFALQIGDGSCAVAFADGEFSMPVPNDDKCFLNVTTSICDSDAFSHFRHFFSRKTPLCVFVASDGVDDCFAGQNPMYDFYRLILKSFTDSKYAEAKVQLESYLPTLSADGSGDDISLGMLADIKSYLDNRDAFEGKPDLGKVYINIDTNLVSDRPNDRFYAQAFFPAKVGSYCLDEYDYPLCNQRKPLVISEVLPEKLTLTFSGDEYTLFPDTPLQREYKDINTAYNGSKFVASEELLLEWKKN